METAITSILFLATAMICTIAAIVISFHAEVQWSIACGAVAVIMACCGMLFVLRDMKKKKKSDKEK